MTTENPIVLSPEQAARSLGISVSTLAKMRLSGKGPVYAKLGRRVVYLPADLNTWVAASRFNSTSEYQDGPC